MALIFDSTPVDLTWDLGITVTELFTIPAGLGPLTGGVPRSHIRKAASGNPLVLALGPVAPNITGFVLDENARTLTLTVTAKDTYLLSGGTNVAQTLIADIELRFGSGDTAIVWPFGKLAIALRARTTYLYATDTP